MKKGSPYEVVVTYRDGSAITGSAYRKLAKADSVAWATCNRSPHSISKTEVVDARSGDVLTTYANRTT